MGILYKSAVTVLPLVEVGLDTFKREVALEEAKKIVLHNHVIKGQQGRIDRELTDLSSRFPDFTFVVVTVDEDVMDDYYSPSDIQIYFYKQGAAFADHIPQGYLRGVISV